MIEFIPYIAKSVLSFGVFYIFFFIFLRKEASLKFNRFYLLGTAIFSLVIPFITINLTSFGIGPAAPISTSTYYVASDVVATSSTVNYVAEAKTFNWSQFAATSIFVIYLLVAAFLLLRFIANISTVFRNVFSGEKIKYQSLTLILNVKDILPHTFLKYIFLNKQSFQSGAINNEVIQHEKAHVEQLHSIDILLIEIIKIVFWFNPFVWMYKKDIQLNHEYLADQAVLQETSVVQYQQAILKTIELTYEPNLVSNFTYSSIKKRFIMMTKTKTKTKTMMMKLGLLTPLTIAVFLLGVNLQAQENPTPKVEKMVKVEKDDKGNTTKKEIKVEVKNESGKPLSKDEIAKIKKEVEKEIEENKDLSEKEKEDLKKEVEFLEKDLEDLLLDKENLEKEEIRVIKIDKEVKDEKELKQMIFISEDDEEIEFIGKDGTSGKKEIVKVIRLDDEHNSGSKKIFISEDGSKVEVISPDGEHNHKENIWIESIGDTKVKVITNEDKDGYQYEYKWKTKSDEDIDIDIEKIIEGATKDIKVIVNGKTIEIDGNGLHNLDKVIEIEIEDAMDELDGAMDELNDALKEVKKEIRVIKVETEVESQSKKRKNRKKK